MPVERTVTVSETRTQRETIVGYQVNIPAGQPRRKMSASIQVLKEELVDGVVTRTETVGVTISGFPMVPNPEDPDGEPIPGPGKVEALSEDIAARMKALVERGVPWGLAYDKATGDGMYAWIQANKPDVIPPDA